MKVRICPSKGIPFWKWLLNLEIWIFGCRFLYIGYKLRQCEPTQHLLSSCQFVQTYCYRMTLTFPSRVASINLNNKSVHKFKAEAKICVEIACKRTQRNWPCDSSPTRSSSISPSGIAAYTYSTVRNAHEHTRTLETSESRRHHTTNYTVVIIWHAPHYSDHVYPPAPREDRQT